MLNTLDPMGQIRTHGHLAQKFSKMRFLSSEIGFKMSFDSLLLSKSVLIALFAFQIVKNSLFEAKMTKKGSFLTHSNRSLRCFRFMNRYHTTRGFYSMLNSPKFIEI